MRARSGRDALFLELEDRLEVHLGGVDQVGHRPKPLTCDCQRVTDLLTWTLLRTLPRPSRGRSPDRVEAGHPVGQPARPDQREGAQGDAGGGQPGPGGDEADQRRGAAPADDGDEPPAAEELRAPPLGRAVGPEGHDDAGAHAVADRGDERDGGDGERASGSAAARACPTPSRTTHGTATQIRPNRSITEPAG